MPTDETIGLRLKKRRQQVGLSLRELAARTGFTASFLSQVERGQTNTSLNSLRRIAEALEVSIQYFLNDNPPFMPVVRANSRAKLILPDVEAIYELLTPELATKMQVMLGRVKPGKCITARAQSAPSEEFILVMSGELMVELEDGQYTLTAGDSIYFDGSFLKRLACAGDTEDAVWVSVITR